MLLAHAHHRTLYLMNKLFELVEWVTEIDIYLKHRGQKKERKQQQQ